MTQRGEATPTIRRVRLRLFAGLVIPLIAFVVLVRALGNATGALAITDGIPLLWVLVIGVWRRRIEPFGLAAAAVFAIALLVSIATGGKALPLELRRSVFPGAVGIACLVSLVLALTVSTATFGVAARIASYVTIGGGLAVCAIYIRVERRRWGQREG